MQEFKRVLLNKKVIAALLCLTAINLWIYIQQQTPDTDRFSLTEHADFYLETLHICSTMEPEDAIFYVSQKQLQAMGYMSKYYRMTDASKEQLPLTEDESYLRNEIYTIILEQLSYPGEYEEYLEQIKKTADDLSEVSLFADESSFAYKNIQKTLKDFSPVYDAEITVGPDIAVTSLFTDAWSDYMILIFVMILCVCLTAERKNGPWGLIHAAPGGRFVLTVKRLTILLTGSILSCILLFGGKVLLAGYLYNGMDNMDRTIQSIEMFSNVPTVMTVGKFFVFYLLMKIAGTFVIGMCLWAILSAISNTNLSFVAGAFFLSAEYLCFKVIPDSFLIVPLKYINIFSFIEYVSVFRKYLNINLFGSVVEVNHMISIILPIAIILLIALLILIHENKKPVSDQNILLRFWDRISRKLSYHLASGKMIPTEYYKTLLIQKGILLLAILMIFQYLYAKAPPREYQAGDQFLSYYKAKLEGPVNDDTLQFLNEEAGRLNNELSELDNSEAASFMREEILSKLHAVTSLSAKTDELISIQESRNIQAYILETSLYDAIFNDNVFGYQRKTALLVILFIVLLLSGVFSYENQSRMNTLLRTGVRGREKLWRVKILISLSLAAVVCAAVYGTELILALQQYGNLHSTEAPIQSLSLFSDVPVHISISSFTCLFYALRLLSTFSLTCLVLLISQFSVKTENAVVINSLVLLVPAALHATGMEQFSFISFIMPVGAIELLPDRWAIFPVTFFAGLISLITNRYLFFRLR